MDDPPKHLDATDAKPDPCDSPSPVQPKPGFTAINATWPKGQRTIEGNTGTMDGREMGKPLVKPEGKDRSKTSTTDQVETDNQCSPRVARKKGAPARARRETPAVKRNALKPDDTPPAKRRALDSFINEEEIKVTTAKARGLKTEHDLPTHLKVPPTERTTLALTDEDISILIEFMPKVRKGFRFAFDKEGHLRVKFQSLLEQTVTRKGVTTDRYSHAIKWSNVRDYGVRKAAEMSSGALTVDGQVRLRRPKRVKDKKTGGVTKRDQIDLEAMDARERQRLMLDIIDTNQVAGGTSGKARQLPKKEALLANIAALEEEKAQLADTFRAEVKISQTTADRLRMRFKKRDQQYREAIKFDYRHGPFITGAKERSPSPVSEDSDPEKTEKLWNAKMRKLQRNVQRMKAKSESASTKVMETKAPEDDDDDAALSEDEPAPQVSDEDESDS